MAPKAHEYLNGTWGDRLTKYDVGSIQYNEAGYPTMYRGHVLSWEKGNLQYFDNTDFIYNDSGIRIAKGSTDYFVKGNQILAEKRGSTVIHYYYDENGVAGFEYAGQQYYYRKNLQGDIIGIYDSCGNLLGEYKYDAWVNILSQGGSNILTINPFRYRGYYYDEETGLYYLNSRYYDPETGRFISPDDVGVLNDTFTQANGLNLYLYCYNNPVMMTDPDGKEPLPWWAKILIGAAFIIAGAVVTALTAGTGTGFVAAFGAALLTSLQSAAISSAIGAGIGLAMGGLTSGSWEGALEGLTSGLIDGFMWGGVFAGGAQILSGAFKGYAQVANHFGKLQNVKKSPLFSPDRLKNAKEIAKIAKKGQAFYDYGGTLIRIGKIHLDVSTKSLLHLSIFGIKHFPIGMITAGLLGGIE